MGRGDLLSGVFFYARFRYPLISTKAWGYNLSTKNQLDIGCELYLENCVLPVPVSPLMDCSITDTTAFIFYDR